MKRKNLLISRGVNKILLKVYKQALKGRVIALSNNCNIASVATIPSRHQTALLLRMCRQTSKQLFHGLCVLKVKLFLFHRSFVIRVNLLHP